VNFVDTGTDDDFKASFMRMVPQDGEHFSTSYGRGRLEVVKVEEGTITYVIAGHADRDDMAWFWYSLNGGWLRPTGVVIPKDCYPELALINVVGHHRGLLNTIR